MRRQHSMMAGLALAAGLGGAALAAGAADDPSQTPPPAAFADSVINPGSVWRTANGESHIRFEQCGEALCGYLNWFANLERQPERDHIDHSNPDPALRGQPLLGIRLLWGFTRDDGKWEDGRIYRPRNGAVYHAEIREIGADAIEIKGCKLLFCRRQVWTRIEKAGGAS